MGFFSKAFKAKSEPGSTPKSKKRSPHTNGAVPAPPPKPLWDDAWTRRDVDPEEVQELLRVCTHELKSRALDLPFLLLPFRPASDPSAARTFIRNFFGPDKGAKWIGRRLEQEILLAEPMVISSVMKWCWSRLPGGLVTWEAYELFRVGEQDADMARDAFATFIPLSVESDARTKIIFDFFDLMAAIAAHGKSNGMGGRKLSRLAGWWAFDEFDTGNGFDGGYKSWIKAADATSHLFFAYLRSLTPDSVQGINGVSTLPLSLQSLVQETRYPPEQGPYEPISKVVMVVDNVSPTPFALLRRARHFQFRENDRILHKFSEYEDPVEALTDECKRVLKSISSANQSDATTAKASTSLGDASWSRFEDVGFGDLGSFDEDEEDESALGKRPIASQGLRTAPESKSNDLGRPTTPSWADFLSSGFADEPNSPTTRTLILPPDKVLPPIDLDSKRGKSSQSHRRPLDESKLEPGELASINALNLDDAFWWVWITSLAGEETSVRKAVFGRCALIETTISGGAWLVVEEMVKGAAPEPEVGAYIAEKKSRFTFGKRSKTPRTKSIGKDYNAPQVQSLPEKRHFSAPSKTSIGPDQHARIQAAAAALQQKQKQTERGEQNQTSPRRARQGDAMSTKTNSVFTLQPVIMSEAAPAMKWANSYDKKAIRTAYLGNNFTGKGSQTDLAPADATTEPIQNPPPKPASKQDYGFPTSKAPQHESRELPALPPETPGENLKTSVLPPQPSSPPAPLPIASEPRNIQAKEAAQVPLPATTPLEPTEKPPPPPPSKEPVQDAEDGGPLEETETVKQNNTNGTLSPVPNAEGQLGQQKLKKQPGSGGLRGIFGNKRKDLPPARVQVPDSSAVAAARAAYSGPTKRNLGGSNSLTRRLSGIGRKKPQPGHPVIAEPIQDNGEPLPPPPPAPFVDGNHQSQTSLSRIDSHEELKAKSEFQTFDQQGPLDQPAFVPEDTPRNSVMPDLVSSRPSTSDQPTGPLFDPPIGRGEYEPSVSTEEEFIPVENNGRPYSPAKNRWSQIRRNAAERAGRAYEDQKNEDSGHGGHMESAEEQTEDGEESGEETIESRVARIKARVAELTGGMQQTEPAKA